MFILLFIGFKVETDVEINASSVPQNSFRGKCFEGSDLGHI